jgi:hypothetical protein
MTDEGLWSGGFVVLNGDVRVGTGGISGTGISSLPPEARAQLEPLLVATELGRAIVQTPLARTVESRTISQASVLTVELQTIEMHEAGCVASLHCLAGPELGMRSGHSGFIAVIEIGDDRRTSYEVQSGLWRFNGANGAGEFYFRPRPAEGVGELTISVARLASWQSPAGPVRPQGSLGTAIEGPWVFRLIV